MPCGSENMVSAGAISYVGISNTLLTPLCCLKSQRCKPTSKLQCKIHKPEFFYS